MAWTATTKAYVSARNSASETGSTATYTISTPTGETTWTNGTGAGAINLAWNDTTTASTGGTTLDLTSLADSGTTPAATFTAIKFIKIVNNDATNTIIVGNAASNQFTPGWSSATNTETIQPGGVFYRENPTAAGWTTSSANNLKIVAGASTPSYTLTLGGLD